MKKHLLIFCFAVLLMAGLNLRNNTALITSDDFPAAALTHLSQRDDSRKTDIAREANSLFALPSAHNTVSGVNNNPQLRVRLSETLAFLPQLYIKTLSEPVSESPFLTIAFNGAFHRPSDYYVYKLRRIVI